MTTDIGRKFEGRWSKRVKGRTTLGSGNLWWDKEDVKCADWLFQNKATDNSYFVLKFSDLKKLEENAEKTKRKSAFVIEFNSGNIIERTCYVVLWLKDSKLQNLQFKEIKSKQIKLIKEELDQLWLSDENFAFVDKKSGGYYVIMNELDFLKEFKEDFSE